MILNRRHLRVKVLQTLYAYSQQEEADFLWAKKELEKAIDQMYDLYILLLQLLPEIKSQAEHRIEENKKKMLPTEEDLNPNLKLVENVVFKILENDSELKKQAEQRKMNWLGAGRQELIRKMFNQIRQSEVYFEFMNNGKSGFDEDKEFIVHLFKTEVANFPLLYDYLEGKSIYWIDDIDLICAMVIKTIKIFQPDFSENTILPLFKSNDDEEEFINSLLRHVIKHRKENLLIIDDLTENWELDRIAKMDILLMELAITELMVFDNIPTRVTLNEYIEISKYYSTPKSNLFINGVLDKAVEKLSAEGKIKKIGRGLMK